MSKSKSLKLVNYKDYLQERINDKLKGKYTVYNERNLDSDLVDGDVILVAKSGPVYASSCQIPYEIYIMSRNPEEAIDFFTALFAQLNNKVFTTVVKDGEESYLLNVRQTYQSPTTIDPDVEIGADHLARIVGFATLFITINVNDITSIEIDGESIEFENATLAYVAEEHSIRRSGDIVSRNKPRTVTSGLSFTMVSKSSVFGNKLFKLIFHQIDANTTFSVKVTTSSGLTGTLTMCVSQQTLSSAKGSLPGSNINLVEYDTGA